MDRSSLHSRAVRPSEHLDVSGPHTTASQVWSECEALEKVNGHGTSTRVALGLMAYATSQKRLRLIKGPSECMVPAQSEEPSIATTLVPIFEPRSCDLGLGLNRGESSIRSVVGIGPSGGGARQQSTRVNESDVVPESRRMCLVG